MFWNKKVDRSNRFIIAIKDYSNTIKNLKEGTISLPFNKDIYLKLIESQGVKVDNHKELGKFIKLNKKIKNEVYHFWEALISEGYTLINVKYTEKVPSLEQLCSKDAIKFVCEV